MSKRATFTASDVTRALKGAAAAGVAAAVVIRPDGTMLITPANDAMIAEGAGGDLDTRLDAFASGRR